MQIDLGDDGIDRPLQINRVSPVKGTAVGIEQIKADRGCGYLPGRVGCSRIADCTVEVVGRRFGGGGAAAIIEFIIELHAGGAAVQGDAAVIADLGLGTAYGPESHFVDLAVPLSRAGPGDADVQRIRGAGGTDQTESGVCGRSGLDAINIEIGCVAGPGGLHRYGDMVPGVEVGDGDGAGNRHTGRPGGCGIDEKPQPEGAIGGIGRNVQGKIVAPVDNAP